MKSKKLPGNQLSFFKSDASNGIMTFTDSKIHEVKVSVGDFAGNTVHLRFWVKSRQPEGFVQVPLVPVADTTVSFKYNKVNKFENNDLKVEFPIGSIYEDMIFRYRKSPAGAGMFSDIHYLHNAEVPIHSRIKVSVKADKIPQHLRSKALLVRVGINMKIRKGLIPSLELFLMVDKADRGCGRWVVPLRSGRCGRNLKFHPSSSIEY